MKRFLLNSAFFIIPIIIVYIVLESIIRQIPNDYSYKAEYLNDNAESIETLILGSSHSYYGLNPEYFSGKTFNSAYISQSLDYDCIIFNKYKNNFNSLKRIYLPISYFSLWEKVSDGKQKWRCKMYFNSFHFFHDVSFADMLSRTYDINDYKYKFKNYYLNNKSSITCTKHGWGICSESDKIPNLITSGKKNAAAHNKKIDSAESQTIFKSHIADINEMVRWCEKKNIEVILFTPPAYYTYRRYMDDNQQNRFISTSESLASNYNNCIYINLLSDTTFTANDFYDADHLSEIGAKKLSKILDRY